MYYEVSQRDAHLHGVIDSLADLKFACRANGYDAMAAPLVRSVDEITSLLLRFRRADRGGAAEDGGAGSRHLCKRRAALAEALGRDAFDPALTDEIGVDLCEGLERREFVPYFQPQVRSSDRSLVGVETLARWKHPRRGLLAPGQFLPDAARLGLVSEIDTCVLQAAEQVLRGLAVQGIVVPKISFNINSERVFDPRLIEATRTIGALGTTVAYELLESILVEDQGEDFSRALEHLREAGAEIEVDDFGSGRTSVIGFLHVDPTTVKIDKRLVWALADDPKALFIMRKVLEMAEEFGMVSVAEGIETAEQADLMTELGCDVLQGYLFSRPLSAEGLTAYLESHISVLESA